MLEEEDDAEAVDGDYELTPRPTASEMRSYILTILGQLQSLSLEYGLKELALGIALARDTDRRFRQ